MYDRNNALTEAIEILNRNVEEIVTKHLSEDFEERLRKIADKVIDEKLHKLLEEHVEKIEDTLLVEIVRNVLGYGQKEK